MSFRAIFSGKCAGCGEQIVAKVDWIELYGGYYVHEGCIPAASPVELKKNEVTCTECWLVQPCEC